jgi:hypothetical protein
VAEDRADSEPWLAERAERGSGGGGDDSRGMFDDDGEDDDDAPSPKADAAEWFYKRGFADAAHDNFDFVAASEEWENK